MIRYYYIVFCLEIKHFFFFVFDSSCWHQWHTVKISVTSFETDKKKLKTTTCSSLKNGFSPPFLYCMTRVLTKWTAKILNWTACLLAAIRFDYFRIYKRRRLLLPINMRIMCVSCACNHLFLKYKKIQKWLVDMNNRRSHLNRRIQRIAIEKHSDWFLLLFGCCNTTWPSLFFDCARG